MQRFTNTQGNRTESRVQLKMNPNLDGGQGEGDLQATEVLIYDSMESVVREAEP